MATLPPEPGQVPEAPDPAGNPSWGEPLPNDGDEGLEPVRENPEPD